MDNKVYVLYRWLPMQFAERYEKEELTEGVLKVLVVRAKNLRADDGASKHFNNIHIILYYVKIYFF